MSDEQTNMCFVISVKWTLNCFCRTAYSVFDSQRTTFISLFELYLLVSLASNTQFPPGSVTTTTTICLFSWQGHIQSQQQTCRAFGNRCPCYSRVGENS